MVAAQLLLRFREWPICNRRLPVLAAHGYCVATLVQLCTGQVMTPHLESLSWRSRSAGSSPALAWRTETSATKPQPRNPAVVLRRLRGLSRAQSAHHATG